MALDKPYLDVPGTTIFDADQSRKGYWLNQFCMSLMKDENRKRFKADEDAYLAEWPMTDEQRAAVRGVVQNTTQKNMVSTIVGSLNQIMEVLILVAVLLAVVILYNLTNLNVSERIRELSTIKVLGFHTSETTMYIYRETILLSLLGILAGYGFGEWLHRYIITEVPPDEVMFDPAISWIALGAPAIVVAVALAVLGWIVYRQLETVDMLEALKSVE